MAKLSELDGPLKEIVSETAADIFERRYPNLLAMFSAGDVYSAIASYIRVEGFPEDVKDNFVPATLCKFTERAFLELLRRNALDQFVRVKFESGLPPEIEQELDAMEISAGVKQAPVKVDPRKAQDDLLAECVRDYKGGLDGRRFQAKWMGDPQRRQVYESACAKGLV